MLGLGSGACVQLAATPTRRPRSRRTPVWSVNRSAVELKAPRRPSAARRWQREPPARAHDGAHASCASKIKFKIAMRVPMTTRMRLRLQFAFM